MWCCWHASVFGSAHLGWLLSACLAKSDHLCHACPSLQGDMSEICEYWASPGRWFSKQSFIAKVHCYTDHIKSTYDVKAKDLWVLVNWRSEAVSYEGWRCILNTDERLYVCNAGSNAHSNRVSSQGCCPVALSWPSVSCCLSCIKCLLVHSIHYLSAQHFIWIVGTWLPENQQLFLANCPCRQTL